MAGGAGTCVACYTPTDTALGYTGSVEGHVVFLHKLGLPMAEAEALAEGSPLRPVDEAGKAVLVGHRDQRIRHAFKVLR